METATIKTIDGDRPSVVIHRNGSLIVTEYDGLYSLTHEATGFKVGVHGFNTAKACKGYCDELAVMPEWVRIKDRAVTGISAEEKKALGMKVRECFHKWDEIDDVESEAE